MRLRVLHHGTQPVFKNGFLYNLDWNSNIAIPKRLSAVILAELGSKEKNTKEHAAHDDVCRLVRLIVEQELAV